MNGYYIKAEAGGGGVSRSTAKLMKTGQTTSYRTGDDGDFEAGRDVDFFTLAENNPFGNTDRFTDELGTQTYTNNIVIDWSTYDGATVLGYRRTTTFSVSWNAAIDAALIVSIAPFTSGWRLPNIHEYINICNYESSLNFTHPPFNIALFSLLSSTTVGGSTANCLRTDFGGTIVSFPKLSSSQWIPCRTFTVTGTTLS